MSKTNEKTDAALSPAWLTAGAVLFGVAVSAPLLVMNYLPSLGAFEAGSTAKATNGSLPLAEQADGVPEYPEVRLAETDGSLQSEMGSLATLIDQQGVERPQTSAPAVRRMVLDAISVDLESSITVDALDHLRVPIRDCDQDADTADAWLIDDGQKIGNALHALPSDLAQARTQAIAGPIAQRLATTHEGIRVEYCADLTRIAAVEILPLEPGFDPGNVLNIAELQAPVASVIRPALPQSTRTQDEVVLVTLADTLSTEASVVIHPASNVTAAAPNVSFGVPNSADPVDPVDHPAQIAVDRTQQQQIATRSVAPAEATPVNPGFSTDHAAIQPATAPSPQTAPALLALNGDAYVVTSDIPVSRATDEEVSVILASMQSSLEPAANLAGINGLGLGATYEVAENDLKLNRKARWRAQLRLALLGHDPKGIDGIFGDGTRNAIASLQTAEQLPRTGYLDEMTLAVLKKKSQRRYTNWFARRAQIQAERAAQKTSESAPQKVATMPAARRAPGCARDNQGVIISNQSFGCDLSVLREGLGSLFGTSG